MINRIVWYCSFSLLFAGSILPGCAPQKVLQAPLVSDARLSETPAPDAAGGEGEAVAEQKAVVEAQPPLTEMEFENDQSQPELTTDQGGQVLILPDVQSVDQRMMVYANKLSSWESLGNQASELDLSDKLPPRWHGCLAEIDSTFRGYSVLMEALLTQDHPSVVAEEFALDPWRVYRNDISFLEGGCREVFVAAAALVNNWDTPPTETEVRESEHEVVQLADEGRNEDAITAFQNLVDSQPDLTVSANTSKMYGLALLRTGKFDQAAEVLLGTLENMRPSNEERSLRRLVADLLLASGSVEKARWHYRKLADYFESRKGDDRWVADQLALLGGVDINAREFPLYMEVLQGFISFDGRHVPPGMRELVDRMEEDFRESPLSDQARRMLGQLEDSSREWVAGQLDAVDVLAANDDYGQAKSRLEQVLFDDLPAAVHETVQRSMDILLQAEKKYLEEQKAIRDEVIAAQWDKGVLLLDSQKYDEAIYVFTGLFDTIYDVPARVNIEKAAEAASIEMRRESASIFVKARREKDYERKKELLRESWQLLNNIIVKYPGIALIDKIRQNLELIEDHIKTIAPSLLQELKGSGAPANKRLPVDPA